MATGEGAKLNKYCKKKEAGGSGVAQKLLELMGALEGLWPLGKKQNSLNMCEREDSGGSGLPQKL